MKYNDRISRYVSLVNKYLQRNKDKGKYDDSFIKGYCDGIKSGINWSHIHKHWHLCNEELPEMVIKEEYNDGTLIEKSKKVLCAFTTNNRTKYITGQYCKFTGPTKNESEYWSFDTKTENYKPIAWMSHFEFNIEDCTKEDI